MRILLSLMLVATLICPHALAASARQLSTLHDERSLPLISDRTV